jgi:hypothetical protein
LALTLIGLTASFIGAPRATSNAQTWQHWRSGVNGLAVCFASGAVLLNEVVLARFIALDGELAASTVRQVRLMQAALLIAGLSLVVARSRIARAILELKRALSDVTAHPQVVAICLVVPWLVLAIIATTERRFWWLWPLQVVAIAAAVTYVPMRTRARRWVTWVGSLAVIPMVAGNPVSLSRVGSWMEHGWSGENAPEIAIVDQVAALMPPGEARQASIGYDVDIWRFMATSNIIDSRYKVGADFDFLFKYRTGITNVDRCAEGFAVDDEYRIVQLATIATSDPIEGRNRITSPRDGFVETAPLEGPYQVFVRYCSHAEPCLGHE